MYPAERVLGHSRGHPSTEVPVQPSGKAVQAAAFTSAGQLHWCFPCNLCAPRAPAAPLSSHSGIVWHGAVPADSPALNELPCLPGAFISCWCNTWPFWKTTCSCSRCSMLTSLFCLYPCTTLNIFCWAIETNLCTSFSQAVLCWVLSKTVSVKSCRYKWKIIHLLYFSYFWSPEILSNILLTYLKLWMV